MVLATKSNSIKFKGLVLFFNLTNDEKMEKAHKGN